MVLFSTIFCCQALGEEKRLTAPGIGYIEVRSDLDGARVYFDTLYMGHISHGKLTIPVDTTVTPSWKNVRMEYSGYLPYAGPYTQTEAGKTIAYKIDLSKTSYDRTGIVRFISEPAGAEFLLNDKSMGITPDSGILIAYTVPRGLYTVNAQRPGDQTITDQLYVDDNAATTYRVTMIPSPLGELDINSKPEGGTIFIDNRMVGITPLHMKEIPTGEHTIQIRMDGYQDWTANVSVLGGSLGSVEAVLVSNPLPVVPAESQEPVKQ
ncbi:MAG TPA: PEGA domain-containing protein [Methanospirillum sp.]|uniref:PEGA domain-containing protein n=1 Tax=Methanospirillum sp. TaxID=45200 RepID=UPI002CB4E16F|nr:PEGA domain-containing protein [Methanospirillum sp.]HOJ96116.1 PEGA domain-containing protein [Methanospirillum sp.]HOL42037.1 PEGA domain-containing protein [Methanospirillum sp.]HPP77873.1 PEGA domain-containing protein [Methanospirillum sp.]